MHKYQKSSQTITKNAVDYAHLLYWGFNFVTLFNYKALILSQGKAKAWSNGLEQTTHVFTFTDRK